MKADSLKNATEVWERIVTLPCSVNITEKELEYVNLSYFRRIELDNEGIRSSYARKLSDLHIATERESFLREPITDYGVDLPF